MDDLVTPKQVARAIGVSESTLKRWCDQGILPSIRTAGGHRRLEVQEVIAYLRHSGREIQRPDMLGLPSNTGKGARVISRTQTLLVHALIEGDEVQCRRLVFDLYLQDRSIREICDDVLSPTLYQIGKLWGCGDIAIYQERRCCEITQRILFELQRTLRQATESAPIAIGGTLVKDPYQIATMMAGLILKELGWNAESLGSGLPVETVIKAVVDIKPKLVWLSVSCIDDTEYFIYTCNQLHNIAAEHRTALVLGGCALGESLRKQLSYTVYCDNFKDLANFASSLT